MTISRNMYKKRLEVIAPTDKGKIKPVLSHLKILIFLLIILAIVFIRSYLKLFINDKYFK